MLATAIFWLILLLPGLALLRGMRCPWLAYGVPSSITLSYLTTFALLSPISVAGYLFRWPLWVLSTAVVALALLGAGWLLWRDRAALRGVHHRIRWWSLLGMALIAADAIVGLRSGSHTAGDATYHTARVRMLFDLGFNNWDPFVPGHHFDSIYHTNLYHALLASSAQLTGLFATDAWVYSLFFAKLVCPGAIYFLSFVTLGRRWLAWLSTGMFVVWNAAYTVQSYPNTLAAFVLFPLAIGFCIEALTRRRGFLPAIGLGVLSLVSVQVHGLYYVLCCCLVAPPLLLRLVHLTLRHRMGRAAVLASIMALGAGVPWLAVTAVYRVPNVMAAPPPEVAPLTDADGTAELEGLDRGFLRLQSGWLMFDPRELGSIPGPRFELLVALLVGLCSRRRRQFVALGAVVATLFVILYVPPVCTLLTKLLGAPWVVKRFVVVHQLAHDAICPAVYFSLIRLRFAGIALRFARPALKLAGFGLAFTHAYYHGVNGEPWTHKRHVKRAVGSGRANYLSSHRARREHYLHMIKPEQTVVIHPGLVPGLVVDCNCYPLAAPQGNRGVPDMDQRRVDAQALVGLELDLPARIAMMKRYGVEYLVVPNNKQGNALRQLLKPMMRHQRARAGMAVFRIDLNRPLPVAAPEPTPPTTP